MQKPSENIRTPHLYCATSEVTMKIAGRLIRTAGILLVFCAHIAVGQEKTHKSSTARAAAAAKASASAPPALSDSALKRLKTLCEQLRENNSTAAYAKLSAIAMQKASGGLNTRAALALGFYDYSRNHYAEADKWLERAKSDRLLGDYALYWAAETDLAQQQDATALAELRQVRQGYPDSVITEQVLQSIAVAAMALSQPGEAVSALNSYAMTEQRPELLLLRAEALERAGQPVEAASDYQAIYMRFALSEQAREAAVRIDFLRGSPAEQIPQLSIDQRFTHAGILFNAKEWGTARSEYAGSLQQLSGADLERAELRILECGVALGASPSEMMALKISDPDVDAERSYTLADYYRSRQQEAEMAAAVEDAVSRAPSSRWAASALFLAGNFYWVRLDRDRSSGYYKRFSDQFPSSPDAVNGQWRVAWTLVLKRAPEAADQVQEHLRRFPGSVYTPDALYWLGRLAEEAGVPSLARGYYDKLIERFPQNYFEALAIKRVRELSPGPKQDSDVLATIPVIPALQKLGETIPPAAAKRHARAIALQSIAFDASAELELRAAYAATGEPRLLLEAAQAAVEAGHCGAAIVAVRQIYPQLEAHPLAEVPRPVWLAAYALPFQSSIRHWSEKAGVDPMLVAGLVRQESAFSPEARSPANAFGLMQLLPSTARRLAKQEKIRYAHPRLLEPDYNVRLGTAYVAGLEKQFGNIESVLAAYNAGEDRVQSWTEGQNYREPAEFVESIPFTETRQYVQIVTRNADIYRRLYGDESESRKGRTTGGH
jgi:peptidoglycan lytic transglycosylase